MSAIERPAQPTRARGPGRGEWLAAGVALAAALAIRAHNLLHYPADWGFDASFNWRYLYRLSRDLALPNPAAGWSTGDPPLYYALAAVVFRGLESVGARDLSVYAIPLLSVAAGLAVAALAWALVRCADPGAPGRALLAAGLLLFLPAHVQMSAMVNEEMLTTLFTSLALFALVRERIDAGHRSAASGAARVGPVTAARVEPVGAARVEPVGAARAAAVGAASGAALLTKLSGGIAVATAAASFAAEGLRPGRRRAAAVRVALVLATALAVGGWYYVRTRVLYGYFQPFGLPAHERMFQLPPGARGPGDYLRVPLSTFTDPQMLDPGLLHSVWGGTYASTWFDAHRNFLPAGNEGVRRLGTATLVLALLPTGAFLTGLARGARRALRDPARSADLPLVLLTLLSLAGYALYTWRNPWFVVVKGTSLLGLSLPYACYASGELARWSRTRSRRALVAAALASLALCVAAGTTFDGLFPRPALPGLEAARPAP